MIIEWLQFWIKPSVRDLFLEQDAKIWTPVLAAQPGFINKEHWQQDKPEHLVTVVRWQSREQWKAIPLDLLETTENKFAQAVGQENYCLFDCLEYPVLTTEHQ